VVRFYSFVSLSLVFLFVQASPADDWPQWRGPRRDGISRETGLAPSWPDGGPPRLWSRTGLGEGFSTPSVVGNRLLTMGNRGDQELVIALDVAAAGKELWAAVVGPVRHRGAGYAGPRSTPTVDGDRVYALGLNGDLVCLDLATGRLLWKKDLVADFGGIAPTWGYSESVLIDGDRLLCTPGSETSAIVALNKITGDTIWKSPLGAEAAYASIVVAEVADVRQYVQFLSAGVLGVAAADGKPLWQFNSPANETANISTPVVAGSLVFAASGYGTGGGAVRLEPRGDTFSADERFFTSDMKNHHGGMIVVDGYLYGSSDPGILTCIELATGETKWQERKPKKGSLVYVDGRLITRSEQGKVCLVEVSPQGAQIVGEFEEPDRSEKPAWPHPVVANGRLYLRDQDALRCYDVRTPK
jgi:outer membrane protein assembly factor BamB